MRSESGRHRVAVVLVAFAVTACSGSLGATRAEARDRGFLLSISTPKLVWSAGEPIDVRAELSYLGAGARQVGGPVGELIGFDVIELSGHRKMQAVWLLACRSWVMSRAPIKTPFHKGGGWSAEDPDAAFYEQFFADPEFRLPAGRWQVSAVAPFSLGPDSCGGPSVNLRASLILTVK